MKTGFLCTAILLCILILCNGLAFAGVTPPQDVISESMKVRLIRTEVTVTHKDGTPVHNLKAEDFQLFVDGKAEPIQYFDEQNDLGDAVSDQVNTNPDGLAREGVNYLVFIDEAFTYIKYRRVVGKKLIRGLDDLRPQDRMAIVYFRQREGARVLSDWSNDREHLKRALVEHLLQGDRRNPYKGAARSKRRKMMNRLDQKSAAGNLPTGPLPLSPSRGENTSRLLRRNITRSVDGLTQAMRAFSDRGGRHVLFLACEGWPLWVAGNRGYKVVEGSEVRNPGEAPLIGSLQKAAYSLGYTIYPMRTGAFEDPLGNEHMRSLILLADNTGGKLLTDLGKKTKNPLNEIYKDSRSFYVLGFYRFDDPNDLRSQIQVKVGDPDYRVRHRREAVLPAAEDLKRVQVDAAMLRGRGGDSLAATLGEPVLDGRRQMVVPVELKIPVDQIEMTLKQDGRYHARLELHMVGYGGDGTWVAAPVTEVPIFGGVLKPGDLGIYKTAFSMPHKDYHLVITLYDPVGGKVFKFKQEVKSPKSTARTRDRALSVMRR